jgi:hypothetical protein
MLFHQEEQTVYVRGTFRNKMPISLGTIKNVRPRLLLPAHLFLRQWLVRALARGAVARFCRFLHDGVVVAVRAAPPRADAALTMLGVGAGGRIVQAIERDLNSPCIWDRASSKHVHLQIADAATFRHLMGFAPLPTPISAYTYQQRGLPFYQFAGLDDSSRTGVAGTWPAGLIGAAEAVHKRKKGKKGRRGKKGKHRGGGSGRQRRTRAE